MGLRQYVAIALLLAGTFPALAAREDPEWNPPPEFDFPYPGEIDWKKYPQPKVVEECSKMSNGKLTALDRRGCSKILSPTKCLIITVDKPYKRATPEAVFRHEQGHCNGWKHPFTN